MSRKISPTFEEKRKCFPAAKILATRLSLLKTSMWRRSKRVCLLYRRGWRPCGSTDLLDQQVGRLQWQVRYRVPAVWQQCRSVV